MQNLEEPYAIIKNTAHFASTPTASRILKYLLLSVTFLTSLHLFFQYVNMEVFYQQNGQFYELSNRFDLDDESSVATWFSQAMLLFIGFAAALAAYMQKNPALRKLWALIAAIGIFFSLDEIAGLHERVLQSIHVLLFQDNAPTGLANAWWVVLPFVLVIGGWLVWKMLHLLPRITTTLFVLSGVIFISGAVLIDLITPTVYRETFLQQGIFVAVEETSELLGTVLALHAVISYIEAHHRSRISKALKQLAP